MVVLLIPCLVLVFVGVRRHYEEVARQLSLEGSPTASPPPRHTVLVLVGDVHRGMLAALQYGQTLSSSARAVCVETGPEVARRMVDRWGKWGTGMPLVLLPSPYRSVVGAFLEYLDELQGHEPDQLITVVLPEFVPARWWQHLLHNQTALLIKAALLFRPKVIVTSVPYHLAR
jgi:hypothetical protein